jgi:hypothetical protein
VAEHAIRPGVSGVVNAVSDAWAMPAGTEPDHLRCDHPKHELRIRLQRNGVTVVVKQCLRCGANLGAVPKSSVTLAALAGWDDDLAKRWNDEVAEFYRRKREAFDAEQARQDAEWWAFYERYIQSPEWRVKRAQVLKRAGGVCEGCGHRPPVQVHHTTYDHVGNEMLWELKAVCLPCHQALHPEKVL